MTLPLEGAGVLVTRPRHQSAELVQAISDAGGRAVEFPVIDIAPRSPAAIAAELDTLPAPDIAVFVSRNAVEHGIDAVPPGCRIAAVGDATAAAVAAAGRHADIVPASGYDSEALLAEAALDSVAGLHVRIVRGNGGRELLGDTLRDRGAQVHYLAVYERRRHVLEEADVAALDDGFAAGGIHYVLAMSLSSLEHLLGLLPHDSRERLATARLVSPSARVLKTALDRLPRMRALQAGGPRAGDLVTAMATDWRSQSDNRND